MYGIFQEDAENPSNYQRAMLLSHCDVACDSSVAST